jgi:predicted RNA-binding Zn-ribbon protein involved in translation (DUF1610 family)
MESREANRSKPQPKPGRDAIAASAFAGASARTSSRRAGDLHVCPACDSRLVYPTDWAPAPARRWSVQLRCPECEWGGGGVYSQQVVDRFDEALDAGTEALLTDLNLLARANMEDEVERFLTALDSGHILPEDF